MSAQTLKVRVLDPRLGTEFPLPAYATAGSAGSVNRPLMLSYVNFSSIRMGTRTKPTCTEPVALCARGSQKRPSYSPYSTVIPSSAPRAGRNMNCTHAGGPLGCGPRAARAGKAQPVAVQHPADPAKPKNRQWLNGTLFAGTWNSARFRCDPQQILAIGVFGKRLRQFHQFGVRVHTKLPSDLLRRLYNAAKCFTH